MRHFLFYFILVICFSISVHSINAQDTPTGNQNYQLSSSNGNLPIVKDSNYIVEEFVSGLQWPSTMSFIDKEKILVLEKNSGKVRLIENGILHDDPVLEVSVNGISEQGLLGILFSEPFVYLYFTESDEENNILGNRIYKYTWDGSNLINPELVKELPFGPRGSHNGGILVENSNGTIFTVIGDLHHRGKLQNYPTGEPDDTGVIIPINVDEPYYAIGIRNSFGLAVDPITDQLWDTENMDRRYDEINLVSKGFNSGWDPITGPAKPGEVEKLPKFENYTYSDPEFSWESTIAPTAISFVNSDIFFKYKNSVFVGDFLNGFLYEFNLNKNRSGFEFNSNDLKDKVVNQGDSISEIVFGIGFGGISDIKFGPDGLMYIVSIVDGKIYRILPTTSEPSVNSSCNEISQPRLDLSYCDLSNRNFSNQDLSFSNLSYTDLTNANFSGSRLTGVNFTEANLNNTDLANTNLINSIFLNVNFNNIDISSSDLRYSVLTNSNFEKVTLVDSTLRSVNLEGTSFNESNLSNSIIYFSNVKNSKFTDSILNNSDLRRTNFSHSTFSGINLANANLEHTQMDSMFITNSDFSNTILTYVNFTNSNITDSIFSGSYPYSANFSNTKISNEIRDTCLGTDLIDRIINKILREFRELDFILLKQIESIFLYAC
ncbi:MAG: hypothetical protein CMD65_05235 [Gammaproteobacteria bacterium]|nr:hypothetical protein [Gammaproteobacteria bacterium]